MESNRDYLKYWRIIRKYIQYKYELTEEDLEMLLFLYSSGIFTYYEFADYGKTMGWDRHRFKRIKDAGYIMLFTDKYKGQFRKYTMSHKGRMLVTRVYRLLEGYEEIPETIQSNPIMKRQKFSEKVLAAGIQDFNKVVRENKRRRRQSI